MILIICGTSHFVFYSIDFQLNTDFTSQLCVYFIEKSPNVTERSVSQENSLKRAKTRRLFSQNYRLKYYLTLIEKQFQVFKIGKFEIKITVHYRTWAKCTQLWPFYCYFSSQQILQFYKIENKKSSAHFFKGDICDNIPDCVNGFQLAKMEKSIPHMSLPWNL